jgi:signal peptidase I
MEPTLLIGDYLFVSKFTYGYSRYSFPIDLSFIEGRIWEGTPERGDIVVFRPPREPETDYIKRVIGLPGDRIRCRRVCSTSTTKP